VSKLKTHIRLSIVLAVVSLVALVFSHLALTDIYHGEGDLSLEWNVLRGSALILLMFTFYVLIILRAVIRRL